MKRLLISAGLMISVGAAGLAPETSTTKFSGLSTFSRGAGVPHAAPFFYLFLYDFRPRFNWDVYEIAHQPAKEAGSVPTDPQREWVPRLVALTPDQPIAYFLLAEELAAETDDAGARELARRLFVLSYELDQRAGVSGAPSTLAPSACLALASIAVRDDERRWLRALAQTMSEPIGFGSGGSGVFAADQRSVSPETALDAASVLGLCRGGDARRAETLLDKPGVYELIREVDSSRGTPFSIESFIERSRRDWPTCPQCRNRRAVPAGGSSGAMTVCDTCRGSPGLRLGDIELLYQLRIESALLAGTQRSWAAQVVMDGGAPLRDLEGSELAATYEVDPGKPYWRAGAWVANP